MPTPSEQKALAFVAIVVLLGGAVRVVRAGAAPQPTPLEQQALARQASAAESSASAAKHTKGGKGRTPRPKHPALPQTVGGVQSIPFATDRTGLVTIQPGINGSSAPSPRIDTDARGNRYASPSVSPGSAATGAPGASPAAAPIDLDRATEHEIDALPRVGPTLAHRIVANRDSFGPFGSMDALRRVKGLGPATLQRLVPLVTFSGHPSSRP